MIELWKQKIREWKLLNKCLILSDISRYQLLKNFSSGKLMKRGKIKSNLRSERPLTSFLSSASFGLLDLPFWVPVSLLTFTLEIKFLQKWHLPPWLLLDYSRVPYLACPMLSMTWYRSLLQWRELKSFCLPKKLMINILLKNVKVMKMLLKLAQEISTGKGRSRKMKMKMMRKRNKRNKKRKSRRRMRKRRRKESVQQINLTQKDQKHLSVTVLKIVASHKKMTSTKKMKKENLCTSMHWKTSTPRSRKESWRW